MKDAQHVDYVPSVFVFNKVNELKKTRNEDQDRRRQARMEKQRMITDVDQENQEYENEEHESQEPHENPPAESQSTLLTQEMGTQTDNICTKHVETQISQASEVILVPQTSLVYCMPSESIMNSKSNFVDIIKDNDKATSFNTGLPTWKLYQHVSSYLIQKYPLSRPDLAKLTPTDGLLMVLMRLRLNLRMEDLSYRFGISLTSVIEIFQKWIEVMFVHLKFLIKWPTQEIAFQNMPQIFKDLYPRTRCIIDCSEVFIERPYAYQARAKTYSNYKKHNTIKFLIAVTPCGAISFLSKSWGGRATDRCITRNSGFLNLLEAGDVVLADRGFNISEDIALSGARLEIPAFTRGKKQLSLIGGSRKI